MYGKYTNTQRRDSIERSFTWLFIEIPLAFRICVCVCLYLTVPETHVYRRRGGGYLYRVVITWSTFQQFVCYVGMGGRGGCAVFGGMRPRNGTKRRFLRAVRGGERCVGELRSSGGTQGPTGSARCGSARLIAGQCGDGAEPLWVGETFIWLQGKLQTNTKKRIGKVLPGS